VALGEPAERHLEGIGQPCPEKYLLNCLLEAHNRPTDFGSLYPAMLASGIRGLGRMPTLGQFEREIKSPPLRMRLILPLWTHIY
jgi:hypothetical protein